MGKYTNFHANFRDKFLRDIYDDMIKRIGKFRYIQLIKNEDLRKRRETEFLQEQRQIIRIFIGKEEKIRRILKRGLRLQQQDIEGWWKRNVEFGKVKRNCLNNFDNLIELAQKIDTILARENFDQDEIKTLISEIEKEVLTIINLSDDYEIKKYGKGILDFARRNRNSVALAALSLLVSSLAETV